MIIDTSNIYNHEKEITDRVALSNIIKNISVLKPDAVGIDIIFEDEVKEEDIVLVSSLSSIKDILVLARQKNIKSKDLKELATPFLKFNNYGYIDKITVFDKMWHIISNPYEVDKTGEARPFSIKIYETAFNDTNTTDKILNNKKTLIYISFFNIFRYKVIRTDRLGNINHTDFLPDYLLRFHYSSIQNKFDDKNLLNSAYQITKSDKGFIYRLNKTLEKDSYEKLAQHIYNDKSWLNEKKKLIILIGNYYSVTEDKKDTAIGNSIPGIEIHAHIISKLMESDNLIGNDPYPFPFIFTGFHLFIYLAIILYLLIFICKMIYENVSTLSFIKFYVIQNLFFLFFLSILLILSFILYFIFRIRLPITLSVFLFLVGFNTFLYFDYKTGKLLADFFVKNNYKFIPEFVRESYKKYFVENDPYNKLSILINTFELLIQFLAFISVMEIIEYFRNTDDKEKIKLTGRMKDIKQKITNPTTGIFRALLIDIYPDVIKENRFLDLPNNKKEIEELSDIASDFISIRNKFFHKSGSFYTYKTKISKMKEYIGKIEILFSKLEWLKNYELSQNGWEVFVKNKKSGKSLPVSPLIINGYCANIKKSKIFVYNGGIFSEDFKFLDFKSNISDCEPEISNELKLKLKEFNNFFHSAC